MFDRSLPDKAFFPLVALLFLGMITIALEPFVQRKPSGPMSGAGADRMNLTINGDNLYRFRAGSVGEIELEDADDGTVLIIDLEAREAYDTPRYGPHLQLDSDLELHYAGRLMEILIEARAASEWGASQMQANYSTGSNGESGWVTLPLSTSFETYSFQYQVPDNNGSQEYDYLAIRPVVPDKRRAIEIRSITLKAQPQS